MEFIDLDEHIDSNVCICETCLIKKLNKELKSVQNHVSPIQEFGFLDADFLIPKEEPPIKEESPFLIPKEEPPIQELLKALKAVRELTELRNEIKKYREKKEGK